MYGHLIRSLSEFALSYAVHEIYLIGEPSVCLNCFHPKRHPIFQFYSSTRRSIERGDHMQDMQVSSCFSKLQQIDGAVTHYLLTEI